MGILDALHRWLAADETTMYECRNCGRALTAGERVCPGCGSDEIAEYDFR